ncbi:MAG: hypothetical protein JW820_16900 [Spirochaetales bacterium]|nr:hypothetical protein [Spirochaetales bacterium]
MRPAYRLFGVALSSDFPFVTPLEKGAGDPDLDFSCVSGNVAARAGASPPILRGLYETEYGKDMFALHRAGGSILMRFAATADFLLAEHEVRCRPLAENVHAAVETFFLGMVMSVWLEWRGSPCLHASAVDIDGSVAAFLGDNGAGKSALAVALVARGARLVSDDILALKPVPGAILAPCSYPRLRLWPGEAAALLEDGIDRSGGDDRNPKVTVRVGGPRGWGSFAGQTLPLGAIYLLERQQSREDGPFVRFHPVNPGAAVIELVRQSFVAEVIPPLGWQPRRLPVLADIVRRVPMWKISYSSGREHLQAVCEEIVKHVRSQGEQAERQD